MSWAVRLIGLFAVIAPLVVVGGVIQMLAGAAGAGPDASATEAAIREALHGSLVLGAIATAIGYPIGTLAAIYLAEWPATPVRRVLEGALMHLGGMPSIIFGLLGAAIFAEIGVRPATVAVTLALIVLPVAASSARSALRRVPASVRRSSIALGATRWAMLRQVVLPIAMPGLIAGLLSSFARALAETTSLVALGVLDPHFPEMVVPMLGAYAFRAVTLAGQPGVAALALLSLFVPLALLHLAAAIVDARLPREIA